VVADHDREKLFTVLRQIERGLVGQVEP
jgi:hypothetical protein